MILTTTCIKVVPSVIQASIYPCYNNAIDMLSDLPCHRQLAINSSNARALVLYSYHLHKPKVVDGLNYELFISLHK